MCDMSHRLHRHLLDTFDVTRMLAEKRVVKVTRSLFADMAQMVGNFQSFYDYVRLYINVTVTMVTVVGVVTGQTDVSDDS